MPWSPDRIRARVSDLGGVLTRTVAVRVAQAARAARPRSAVVSSGANCHEVLLGAGIEDLSEGRTDGLVVERRHLRGTPAPEAFPAADALTITPAPAAEFEAHVADRLLGS